MTARGSSTRQSVSVDVDDGDSDRRGSERRLTEIELKMALAAQAAELNQKASDAQYTAITRQIEALATEVRTANSNWNTVTADPRASVAGRQLLDQIDNLRIRVDRKADRERVDPALAKVEEHDDFIQQINGALRLAKIALTTSLLSTLGTIILAIAELRPAG